MNIKRKLASVQRIRDIQPIAGADRIEVATINSWKIVVAKNEWKVGDLCVYFEIDSFLPIEEKYEFLHDKCYKILDKVGGYRIKTIKLRNQISQGLIMPLDIIPNDIDIQEDTDLTDILNVTKYDAFISGESGDYDRYEFPSFIPKTDEERIQNLTDYYPSLRTKKYIATEKLDGTSCTFYLKDNHYGVCSRNNDYIENPLVKNWILSYEYNIKEKLQLLGKNYAIQGEKIGQKISGNVYRLREIKFYIFNIFDIDNYKYLNYYEMIDCLKILNTVGTKDLELVPLILENFSLPETIDELLLLANGKSIINNQINREGLVFRDVEGKNSFKIISNNFLLEND